MYILSNSYGEDRSGALIGREMLRLCPDVHITGFPLISLGEEYMKRGIPFVQGFSPPPSGGFLLKSFKGFMEDILTSFHIPFEYVGKLRGNGKPDILLVVGDVPLLFLGWIAFKMKAYFLAPCKSDYIAPHLGIEVSIMRRISKAVFTHDEPTAESLKNKGVKAVFLGNPMMDGLEKEDVFSPPDNKIVIGVLPGSREEAYGNLDRILRVGERIKSYKKDVMFPIAVSPTLDWNRVKSICSGYEFAVPVRNAFVDVVLASDIIISLAGTATEQAAGMGKPVVVFNGTGASSTWKRMFAQKRLLGDAVLLFRYDPEKIAREVVRVLNEPERLKRMGEAGKQRMGEEGGARRIAEFILKREGLCSL